MSNYSEGGADRDAFLAALGRVFAEHRRVSEGYAICDLGRLADVVGGGFDEPVGVSRDDSGRLVTSLHDGFPHPIMEQPQDECFVYVPTTDFDGLPSQKCIMYLTS
jgi:hypothetical protein